MKRTAIVAFFAALFSFGATSFAAADECACKKSTTVSAPTSLAPGELRHWIDYP